MVWLGLLASLGFAEPERFTITVKKPDDAIAVSGDAARTVLTLTSPSGIGQAVVERKENAWPKSVQLRLRLKGLENFRISNGSAIVVASASSSMHEVRQQTISGDKETPIDAKHPLWLGIRLLDADGKPTATLPKDGSFEITLPAAFLKESPKSITFEWIDFYR